MSPLKFLLFPLALLSGLAIGLNTRDSFAKEPAKPAKSIEAFRRLASEGTNEFPSWMVRVSVDRDSRTYKLEETVKVTVVSEKAGYLYLFNINSNGEVSCLFPNKFQSRNDIEANQPVVVPDPKDTSWHITIRKPLGHELLKAVVTHKPLKAFGGLALNDHGGPTPVSRVLYRSLIAEARTGEANANGGGGSTPETLSPEAFKKYLNKAGEWAEHSIEVITAEDKTPAPQRVGLIVGISKYADNSIRRLSGPRNDARRMAETMERTCGLSAKPRVLLDERATLSAIRKSFEELVETTRPGDVVIIYWAGHGGRCAAVGSNGTGAYDAYLVPYDGRFSTDAEARQTMLMDRTFGRWIQELDGRRVVVILDTCHSGGQIEGQKVTSLGRTEVDSLKRHARTISLPESVKVEKPGRDKAYFLGSQVVRARAIGQKQAAVLAAATFRQIAFERREDDHAGVLTYYVLEALEKQSGPLTLHDVYDYARSRVKSYVEKNFEGTTQDPIFAEQEGLPVILKK
jgi:hypothetical protein